MTRPINLITLHRYDLTNGLARQLGPMLLGEEVEGVWHTAIIFGNNCVGDDILKKAGLNKETVLSEAGVSSQASSLVDTNRTNYEYFFDGGCGICKEAIGTTHFGKEPTRRDYIGFTAVTKEEFERWNDLRMDEECLSENFSRPVETRCYGPNSYHLLQNNCNSYTDAACMFLLAGQNKLNLKINQICSQAQSSELRKYICSGYPSDVRELIPRLLSTRAGAFIRPVLEQVVNAGIGVSTPQGATRHQQTPPQEPPKPEGISAEQFDECKTVLTLLRDDADAAKSTGITCIEALVQIFGNIVSDPKGRSALRVNTHSEFFTKRVSQKASFVVDWLVYGAKFTHMDGDNAHVLEYKGTAQEAQGFLRFWSDAKRECENW